MGIKLLSDKWFYGSKNEQSDSFSNKSIKKELKVWSDKCLHLGGRI